MRAAKRVARLRRLLERDGIDAAIVRSTTDLMWLTGFERVFDTEQAHTAVVTCDTCTIHTDSRYATAMKTAAADEGLWHVDDVTVVKGKVRTAPQFVSDVLREQGLETARVSLDAATPLSLYRKLVEALPTVEFVEQESPVLSLRAVKDEAEIAALKRAQEVADAAFMELLGLMRPGRTEREVSLDLEFALRRLGADELAFANIVASGPNSANPHAIPGERVLSEGDLVVVDFGARVNGYRSDTTRTVAIGQPSAAQRKVYNAVRDAHERVAQAIRPNVTGKAMHELAERVLAEHGYAQMMGHGLGHGVGLDIHELPNLSPRNPKRLVAGNVVTNEPGVYIPGECGVRLEDCGVVTECGFESFTKLPHALHVV